MTHSTNNEDARRARLLSEIDEELRYDVLLNESDRGAVIVAAAFVEEALEHLLRQVLTKLSPNADEPAFGKAVKSLVGNASFAFRIDMCFTLGLLNAKHFEAINSLRMLRNSFAHRKRDGSRPKLNLQDISTFMGAFCQPGVIDLCFIGLLPEDVDFDSEVIPMGTPRIGFASATWFLLRSLHSATDWWHLNGKPTSPLQAIPDYDGPTWKK